MWAALQIARKDVRQRLRDRSAYVTAIVAPLGLALILGNLVGNLLGDGDEGTVERWPVAVVDEDRGQVAEAFRGLLRGYAGQGYLSVTTTDRATADALVQDDAVVAAFVLPDGLSEAVNAGAAGDVTVVGNPKNPRESTVAASLATSFANGYRMVQVSVGTAFAASGEEPTEEAIDAFVAQMQDAGPPIEERLYDEAFEGVDYTTYFAAGMTVFFAFFVVQFGILSLMDEREQGTLVRLLGAPIRPASILVGKVLASFVLGLLSVAVMVVATTVLIGAEWGDPVGVGMLAVAGALVAVGFVALISSLTTSRETARSYTELVAVVLGLLGGSFFIVGGSTNAVAQFTWLSPHRWLLEGFQDLSAGDSAVEILPYVGGVLLFAVVTGGIGLLRAHKLVRLS